MRIQVFTNFLYFIQIKKTNFKSFKTVRNLKKKQDNITKSEIYQDKQNPKNK